MRYQHDCERCITLGEFEAYDLYYCKDEPTIVCRYGNGGPDYTSGISFALVKNGKEHYREALIRALMVDREELIEYVQRYEAEFPERGIVFQALLRIADDRRLANAEHHRQPGGHDRVA